jgi:hypothetical protein
MALVGDLIMDARVKGPDPPAVLAPPATPTLSAPTAGATITPLPAATYYACVTYLTNWGETLASSQSSQAVSSGQTLAVAVPSVVPPAVSQMRLYIGTSSGNFTFFYQFTPASSFSPIQVDASAIVSGQPPSLSSAWLPDTDGPFASASIMYSWVQDALKDATLFTGGIEDEVGAGSILNQPKYLLPGRWQVFTDAFYDGYLIWKGTRKDFYYVSQISSLAWNVVVSGFSLQTQIELFPQPQRTSGSTTLSGAITASATTIPISSASNWVVPVGLAQLGPANGQNGVLPAEIIAYSVIDATNLNLDNAFRGLSGTTPQAWPSGTPVNELNIRLMGRRFPVFPQMGSSLAHLDCPDGWIPALQNMVLANYRMSEGEEEKAKALSDDAEAILSQFVKMNTPPTGPKQAGGPQGMELYFPHWPSGHGWVVP